MSGGARKPYYTHFPRTILWLVRGGSVVVPDPGSPAGERTLEVPSFYIGKFPITNEQFEAAQPDFVRSRLSPGDRDPAAGVDLDQALAFCGWYAEVSRKPMRLPTALEWEFACRAGSVGRHPAGDDSSLQGETQWDKGNSGGAMRRLDDKKPNAFGLYGMLGGVWEWTSTRVSENDRRRYLMGGSILTARSDISSAGRRPAAPDTTDPDIGFRIVKSF